MGEKVWRTGKRKGRVEWVVLGSTERNIRVQEFNIREGDVNVADYEKINWGRNEL